jgi:hypothetical protein
MKPDGRYSMISVDSEIQSEADQVRAMKQSVVTLPTVVVTTLITAAASVFGTYFATRHTPTEQPGCLATLQFTESMRVRDQQLDSRLNGIETNVSMLLIRTDGKH